jgi:2-methylisocitrate lyase-like PEP mutase family enzyme
MDTPSQHEKANRFQALHQRPSIFVMPNPFDAGSAHALEELGFEALATSSSASAATQGRRDGGLTREQVLAHVRMIAESTSLPVSADLENGFAVEPERVAETIRLVAQSGAVGGSIEDYSGDPARPIYDLDLAVRRISAAAEVARSLPFPFMLTGRCENFLRKRPDLDNTIMRLRAYEEAGADVLFAPLLPDLAAVRKVAAALKRPLSFMAGVPGKSFSVAELADAGVRRISFGGSLYDVAMNAVKHAAAPTLKDGRFAWLEES